MFRVRWERKALEELADFWNQGNSARRKAITAAADEIDQRLKANAPTDGESREKNRRVLFAPPLMVKFRLEADGKTVSVLQIRLLRH